MYFELDGKKYRVDFHHHRDGGNGLSVQYTECSVYDETTERSTTPVHVGRANVHYKDRFCKETGRKVSLTRAISSWPREKRAIVWKIYHGRKQPNPPTFFGV